MTKKYDYYADKVYVYKYGDPMIEETVRMLKAYYAAAKQRMFVTKWYHNDVVEITAKAA